MVSSPFYKGLDALNILRMIISFHEDMNGIVQHDGSSSNPFPNWSGVKKGFILALTLFGISFSLLFSYAFEDSNDGFFLHTGSDGSLFKLMRLRAKSKVHTA